VVICWAKATNGAMALSWRAIRYQHCRSNAPVCRAGRLTGDAHQLSHHRKSKAAITIHAEPPLDAARAFGLSRLMIVESLGRA